MTFHPGIDEAAFARDPDTQRTVLVEKIGGAYQVRMDPGYGFSESLDDCVTSEAGSQSPYIAHLALVGAR